MKLNQESADKISELIRKSNKILIFNHHNPDGDSIGASLSLYNLLVTINKDAMVVVPNNFTDSLLWIKGANLIVDYSKQPEYVHTKIDEADLLIFVDFNKLDRTGDLNKYLTSVSKPSFLIDHHPDPDYFADVVVVDSDASSASEVVYEVMVRCGYEEYIKNEVAEAIYCGMLTDTGRFNHNSSNPQTFRIIASLLEKGINKDEIHEKIFNVNTASKLKLLGKVLSENMVVLPEYNSAYMFIPKTDQVKYDFQAGDSDGIVNYPLSIKGVKFCALFTENDDLIKISLRSKGDFPANKFSADFFNGGGHLNAAGGRCNKSLKEVIAIFIDGLKQYKELLVE